MISRSTRRRMTMMALMAPTSVALAGCSLEHDPPPAQRTVARFDLEASVMPMPSDIVRNENAARLDLPIEADMSEAEVAFREFLNLSDAWSTTFPASVQFSGPIDPSTVSPATFQIWQWGDTPTEVGWAWREQADTAPVDGPVVELDAERTELAIDPPRAGWTRGGRYVMLLRGGAFGIRDAAGQPIAEDRSFYFVRSPEPLDAYENQRAFPGKTRAERLEVAAKLEPIRAELDPFFRSFESSPNAPIAREDIAALWSFSVTVRTELAMDRSSQRMPIPFDLLVNPDTALVDLPPSPWDTELEAQAKLQLNELDGFGVSPNLMFELTGPVDPATANVQNIRLVELRDHVVDLPIERIKVMTEDGEAPCQQPPVAEDCRYVVVVPAEETLPLRPGTTYALLVRDALTTADRYPISPMLVGHFMRTEAALIVGGENQIDSLDDELALRLETTRAKVAPFLDDVGRDELLTAWPFTTLHARPGIEEAIATAETLSTPPDPQGVTRVTVNDGNRDDQFQSLFPGDLAESIRDVYSVRLQGVGRVVEGTIPMPYRLDRATRRVRLDGGYELESVRFILTVPESADGMTPVPVVIFAHAVVTDRRFVLTIAGELAQRGLAAIAIDLPFHGERIACVEQTLVAFPNFLSEEAKQITGLYDDLLSFPPCVSGTAATCSPTGECLDPYGNPEPFTSLLMIDGVPAIFDLKPASGAAFLDINEIPYIKDHFLQGLSDLGALERSLRVGAWTAAAGVPLYTESFHLAGQSLGAILSAVYAAVAPGIARTVLNVPGADMVDLFIDSTYFGPQFDDYFVREQIVEGSHEQEKLLNIARWLIDSIDPQTVANLYRTNGREAFIQMDSGPPNGDIVIPNRTTRVLQRVSGIPMREYSSVLHADLVVPVAGDSMLEDMADFLAGTLQP